jgi:Fic family protein
MDTSFLPKKIELDFENNQKALGLIAEIDGYRGAWFVLEKTENRGLKELRKIATTQSIGSSTRIEGVTLLDSEIETLLKNLKITKMKTRDEQEIAGYYEVLELIYENYNSIPLSENYIKQLHQLLLTHSTKDSRHRGKYKVLSNQVTATYPDGRTRVLFNTTEPAWVEVEMFDLLNWINLQFEEKRIHPLLIIALFIYEFLSIHPFEDGNGRLSRLLTTLCLLKRGYGFIQYISFENLIEERKKAYYESLMSGQRNRGKKNESAGKWILFFLENLNALTKKLDEKYRAYKESGGYLNERQKQIRDFIAARQPVKFAEAAAAFPDIAEGTLKKDLQYLRVEKIIAMIGKGKGSLYLIP